MYFVANCKVSILESFRSGGSIGIMVRKILNAEFTLENNKEIWIIFIKMVIRIIPLSSISFPGISTRSDSFLQRSRVPFNLKKLFRRWVNVLSNVCLFLFNYLNSGENRWNHRRIFPYYCCPPIIMLFLLLLLCLVRTLWTRVINKPI